MTIAFKQFNSAQELVDYLNDIVLAKTLRPPVMGLHNLTLILDATTVTFADASGAGLTMSAIVGQINAAMSGAAALRNYGHNNLDPYAGQAVRLAIVKDAVVIDKDGTANAILGFSVAADVTVGANAVALADIVQITTDANGSRFSVFHQ